MIEWGSCMIRTNPLPSWFGLPPDVRRELDPILDDYEQSWQNGEPNRESFLARCADSTLRQMLVDEMEYIDQYHRTKSSGVDQSSAPASQRRLPPNIGDYRVIGRIGSGGYGVVFLGFDSLTNRRVAIKVAHPAWLVDKDAEELAREAKILSSLDHPHIVRFLESGVEGHSQWFVVTQWIDGSNLHELLRDGLMNPKQAVDIGIQIAEALVYAHEQGVAHLDVKPRNIMFDEAGCVKLLDFGVAKFLNASPDDGLPERIAGSWEYMAPEQAAGLVSHIDEQTDIFALGVVLREMLVGRNRQAREAASEAEIERSRSIPLHQINPKIPMAIDEICQKALHSDKKRRYQRMSDMLADLTACAAKLSDDDMVDYRAIPIIGVASGEKTWNYRLLAVLLVPLIAIFAGLELRSTFSQSGAAPSQQPVAAETSSLTLFEITTHPPGAHLYFYELNGLGEPIRESEIDVGRSPANPALEPGDYFVSAILDNGEFAEVFRVVPTPNEMRGTHPINAFQSTELVVKLPPIRISEFDSSGMVRIGDFWIDQTMVMAADIPPAELEFGENGLSLNGVRTRIKFGAATNYLESIGKRLPFQHEIIEAQSLDNQIETYRDLLEWTSTMDRTEFKALPQTRKVRRNSYYRVYSEQSDLEVWPEQAWSESLGFRGARYAVPFGQR